MVAAIAAFNSEAALATAKRKVYDLIWVSGTVIRD
jgi:hypothetical protein